MTEVPLTRRQALRLLGAAALTTAAAAACGSPPPSPAPTFEQQPTPTPDNPLVTPSELVELLGGNYQAITLHPLETNSGRKSVQPPQFQVTSKSSGLGPLGLELPSQQKGNSFKLRVSSELVEYPTALFWLEELSGSNGTKVIRVSHDVATGQGFKPDEEEITFFFGDKEEPVSFLINTESGYPPDFYLKLNAGYYTTGPKENLKANPHRPEDITAVHLRLANHDQSQVLTFEANRVS